MNVQRTAVLWLGEAPPSRMKSLLAGRGLTLERRAKITDVDLRTACGIVFNAKGQSGGSIIQLLRSHAERALIHGLQVIVRLGGPNVALVQLIFGKGCERWVFFDPARKQEDLAERLRSHEPGPAETAALKIPSLKPALEKEDQILLRRAFDDCDLITLSEMTDGKSGARVLRAHAKLSGGDPPGYLLPFLVKIDSVENIHTEKDRYHRFVCGHIPFTQRPNLEPLRCVTGANRAVMVSDFVEDAVSLSDICKRPDGRRVVYSLFDDALKSWRRHAFADVSDPKAPITEHLGDIMRVDRISSDVRTEARKFGAAKTPEALAQDLATCSTHEWKLGIIHGDLHPGNIMVRGAEAILIDFASVWDKKKPLVADLACLETGMCFTVAPEDCIKGPSEAKAFEQWCAAIDELFSLSCLMRVPPQQEPTGMSWLRDACRQTRTLAAQLEATPAAYGAALALYLLRRARLGGAKNSKIEAYALLTAERIIGLLKSGDLGATS